MWNKEFFFPQFENFLKAKVKTIKYFHHLTNTKWLERKKSLFDIDRLKNMAVSTFHS